MLRLSFHSLALCLASFSMSNSAAAQASLEELRKIVALQQAQLSKLEAVVLQQARLEAVVAGFDSKLKEVADSAKVTKPVEFRLEKCRKVDWVKSFDKTGWSTCPNHEVLNGLWRNDASCGEKISCIEYANCCTVVWK